ILHSHYDDIDISNLEYNLRRFGMTKGWKLFACIAVNHLGVSPDKMPLYDPAYSDKSEKIFDEILRNGNFGFYSEAYARTPLHGHGLWRGLCRLRSTAGCYVSLFPLIPVEATFLFFHRITVGTAMYIGNAIRDHKKQHSSTPTK
ncbi:MAG: hypothetical protein K2K94_00310, partial [Muribaculaceae bacterium]|nr:hypothetical protein [Muribaculaceae bacterium]